MPEETLKSVLCQQAHFSSSWYRLWSKRISDANPRWKQLSDQGALHRKLWEWCAVSQALYERDMLCSRRTGIGFAVGQEPLASLFAASTSRLLISDFVSGTKQEPWNLLSERADSPESAMWNNIISHTAFHRRVAFRNINIRHLTYLPTTFYDFAWSSCAIDHLGDINVGLKFIIDAMRCIKKGGVAVHTVNYNVSSNDDTISGTGGVLIRRQDVEKLDRLLRRTGSVIEHLSFDPGWGEHDVAFDTFPYFSSGRQHVKVQAGNYVATSLLVIIRKWDEYNITARIG